ncbi:unnamed protein product [Rodentolepis nana]|uniref:EF-hand domain-containing protein n=1 Tax=Rodentolepis nana TaxID=102285 RepID=A0A3P7RVM6_RODNA|nr:unnamed protein product [Rodentolepis nana]
MLEINKDQFIDALSLILNKGSRQEYEELFDKIDVSNEGVVDWDEIASHFIAYYQERDERSNLISVPKWSDLKSFKVVHRDNIQRIAMISNPDRYMSVSREGLIVTYNIDMHPISAYKITTDLCKPRDLWVADVVALPNLNKLACFLSTKEILFAKLDLKLELAIPIKMVELPSAPLCADYWHNPENKHDFFLIWGDVDGYINIIFWKNVQSNLFEYPKNILQEKEDATIVVNYQTIMRESALSAIKRFKAHDDWVRQVQYIPQLDCIISCCTQRKNTIAISWLEKPSQLSELAQEEAFARNLSHISNIEVHQGVNAFDYHSGLSLIAMAGNNCQIALWNPHVTSRSNAVSLINFYIFKMLLLHPIRAALILSCSVFTVTRSVCYTNNP